MSEIARGERVAVACPACSPDLETVHEVLTTGSGDATIRCTECGHTHKEPVPDDDEREVQVVVSQDGDSFTSTATVPADERLVQGEEFVLDTEEAILEVRITDLQTGPEQRTAAAPAEAVETIWARVVDNVSVDVTINPGGNRKTETENRTLYVPGDYEFVVGESEEFGDEQFRVKGLLVREDAFDHGYEHEQLEHPGDVALAKDLRRVYADDETDTAWSAW
jgi:uncharacterized Zn finger protein